MTKTGWKPPLLLLLLLLRLWSQGRSSLLYFPRDPNPKRNTALAWSRVTRSEIRKQS